MIFGVVKYLVFCRCSGFSKARFFLEIKLCISKVQDFRHTNIFCLYDLSLINILFQVLGDLLAISVNNVRG
jgi:hypothetical protein